MTLRGVWALVGVLLAVVACGGSDENGPNGKGKSGAGGGAGSGASGGTGGVGGSGGVETTSCGKELRGSRCLSSGWCFDGPRPEGVDFKAIDGTDDASSAWAVG